MPLPPPSSVPQGETLADRVLVITGATGGLGAPLARACAAQGATVVLHGRIERKLDALYDEIVAAGHPEPVILPLDLASALMPLLDAARDASVVFTLDSRGEQPRAYWGGYAVTKAGVSTLARELADEWENRANLRINAVVPGPIRSPLRNQSHPGEDRAALPLPESIVPLYLHLLAGQTKAESGVMLDAQAWLAGTSCTSLLRA